MATEPLDYSTFIDPFEPCPKELRPYAAFAIGYLVAEIRRHEVALWRKPRHRDGILSDCGFVQDGIRRALLLLSEQIHGAVLVHFYQQLGKVRNDLTLLNRLVSNSSSENYRLKRRVLGRSNWKSLLSLAKRLFADSALRHYAALGIELSDFVRREKAENLKGDVETIRVAASTAQSKLLTQDLEWLLEQLGCFEGEAELLGIDGGCHLAATVKLWSMTTVDKLYQTEHKEPILTIDFEQERICIHGEYVAFERIQRRLLCLLYALAKHPGQYIKREKLTAFIDTIRDISQLHFEVTELRTILRPAILAHFERLRIDNHPSVRTTYIGCLKTRIKAGKANPYKLLLSAEQVSVIGNPPMGYCKDVDLLGP